MWLCHSGLVNCIYHPSTNRRNTAQGFFKVGPGVGPLPTRVWHFLKISQALLAFPFKGGLHLPGNKPKPPKGVKAWGDSHWSPRDLQWWGTPDQVTQLTTRLAKVQPNNWRGAPNTEDWSLISRAPHQTSEFGTRLFLRCVRSQGHSPYASGIANNTFCPVGIPLIRGDSGARK